MARHPWTRREMLKIGAAAALPAFVSARALGLDGNAPASETVRVGVIGCGGRSRLIAEGKRRQGVSTSWPPATASFQRAEQYVKELSGGAKWGVYDDFRKMIEKEKLDGVMVETTTHARAWIACQAMQTGMDAYIEKPMCLTIAEGRHMVNAARKYKRVTQVGTQQRSMPINNWASDLVKNGGVGQDQHRARAELRRPDEVDRKTRRNDMHGRSDGWWDVWTNQAELRPYRSGAPLRLGHVVGLRRRRALLRRHRLGHALLRPDQPRPGHRRHRARRDPARRAGRRARHRQVRAAEVGRRRGDRRHRRRRHRHRLPRHGQAHRPAGQSDHEVRQAARNLKFHLDGDRGPGLGAIFVGEKGKIEINRNKLASNPKEIVRAARQPRPQQAPGNGLPHRELDRVHQEPQAVQRRHRDRPALLDALLSGQHRPRRRPGRRDAQVGPGRRAVHQLRRRQQAS